VVFLSVPTDYKDEQSSPVLLQELIQTQQQSSGGTFDQKGKSLSEERDFSAPSSVIELRKQAAAPPTAHHELAVEGDALKEQNRTDNQLSSDFVGGHNKPADQAASYLGFVNGVNRFCRADGEDLQERVMLAGEGKMLLEKGLLDNPEQKRIVKQVVAFLQMSDEKDERGRMCDTLLELLKEASGSK